MLLAQDRVAHQWTDFGGGVKKSETALSAAFREFCEESKEIFIGEYSSCNHISNCVSWIDEDLSSSCIFVPVSPSWIRRAKDLFDQNSIITKYKNRRCYNEVDDIKWFSHTEFYNMVFRTPSLMWIKCRETFKKFYDEKFYKLLVRSHQQHFP